jgi:hypothetical protein
VHQLSQQPGSQDDACAVQACELMDALKKNLRQEHVLIHEFLSTFYTQVDTSLPFPAGYILDIECPSCIMLPSCASTTQMCMRACPDGP